MAPAAQTGVDGARESPVFDDSPDGRRDRRRLGGWLPRLSDRGERGVDGDRRDDVLALAREGDAATDPEHVSLRSVARGAWDHVVTEGARLIVGTDTHITADRSHLERLFENLFPNSIEHGSTGSRAESEESVEHGGSDVTVSVGLLEDDQGGFYVEDDGPGVPEGLRDQIFESGVSADDGTGFGLAIVKGIADAHGWDVTVTDSDDGSARFEFVGVELAREPFPTAED